MSAFVWVLGRGKRESASTPGEKKNNFSMATTVLRIPTVYRLVCLSMRLVRVLLVLGYLSGGAHVEVVTLLLEKALLSFSFSLCVYTEQIRIE